MAKRRKPGGPPAGFTIDPAARAEDAIRERLRVAVSRLPGARQTMHIYKDGSIDGEVMMPIPRGKKAEDVVGDLYNAIGKMGFGEEVWVSMGARYTIEKDEEVYRKFNKMNEVGTNYQRAIKKNILEEVLILQNKVVRGLKKKFRRKATLVYIRFNWNPEKKQPSRY